MHETCTLSSLLLAVVVAATECEAAATAETLGNQLLAHSSSWRIAKSPVSNGAVATVISDFLPQDIADRWHATLNSSWVRSQPCRENNECVNGGGGAKGTEEEGGVCTWLYTTNSHGGNQKIRSVWTREERRKFVTESYKRGRFSYSKWELSAGHSIYTMMGQLMESRGARVAVARALFPDEAHHRGRGLSDDSAASHLGNISDYFVTAYTDGDFLSTHSDGASGSLAWVLHLAKEDWDADSGGALRFNPGSAVKAARDFTPSFNRLLLFLTRPDFTPHQVLPVKRPHRAEPRFGMTGWVRSRALSISQPRARLFARDFCTRLARDSSPRSHAALTTPPPLRLARSI